MKKFLSFLLLIVSIFSTQSVFALESTGDYKNENGVSMTDHQINNLKSLQFTDKQIANMTQDEFDLNKDLYGKLQSTDTNYYKTTYIPKLVSTYSLDSNEDNYVIINEEITEDEYYNHPDVLPLANCGTGDSCWQTTYKKLKTTITKVGTQYRFRSDIEWLLTPEHRSNDVLAMAFNSTNISPVADSKYGRYDWHMTRYENGIGWYDDYGSTTYNSGHSNWRIGLGGYSLIIPLKTDNISSDGEHIDGVRDQSAYMYFNVQKSTNVTIKTLDVYGSYQHAQGTVSISKLSKIVLQPSAYNIISFLEEGVSEKYDNMRKTHAQLSNISW